MEGKRFDRFAQFLIYGPTRRTAVRLLSGSALAGAVGQIGLTFGSAKGKSKKKKQRKPHRCQGAFPITCSPTPDNPAGICYPNGSVCCSSADGGGACPNGAPCCPPSVAYPTGSCAEAGTQCCSAAAGGGFCPQFAPGCCPPTPQHPLGLCIPSGFQCCSAAQGGGACPNGTVCCPNGDCVPPGVACGAGAGAAAVTHRLRHRQMELPAGVMEKK
jgi:hypothetical protein